MTVYTDRLEQYDEAWRTTEVQAGGTDLPPDGEYQARVERFDFITTKDDHLLLKTELSLVAPSTYSGQRIGLLHSLTEPDRFEMTKRHLLNMGIAVERVSQIEEAVRAALDAIVVVRVKTSDRRREDGTHYRNAYVNSVVTPGGTGETQAPAPAEREPGDEDIPF